MKIFVIALLASVLSVRCAQTRSTDATKPDSGSASSSSAPTSNSSQSGWSAIEQRLRAAGLAMTAAGTIEQPFWTRQARVFSTPAGDIQVYEFPSAADAQTAAKQVGGGGGTIGTSSMAWMAPPHFFRSGNVIVIYLGSSAETLQKLEAVFGKQFEGR
ncbi:MAG TPA: hypothetical protein VHL58_03610 [Thermoanaerobaculia bacterium]|nr:hypothetical protein [Thermoanaerobaculia bacterium]